MARYDQETQDFMTKVADLDLPSTADLSKTFKKDPEKKEDFIQDMSRQGFNLVKGLAVGGRKGLARNVISRGVGIASALDDIEKKASVSPLKLYDKLNNTYGTDWWDWEPETLWQTLDFDYQDTPTEEIRNLLMALQVVSKTNYPFEDWSVFENVGQALNFNPVNFSQTQPLEPDEVALTHRILTNLRPKEEYEDEILGYVAASAKNAGMVFLPDDLFPKGSQEFLNNMGNDEELAGRVNKLYPNFMKGLSNDTAIGVQLSRLSEVQEHIQELLNG